MANTKVHVLARGAFTNTWPSTRRFIVDVQSWADQTASNHGLILIGDEVNSCGVKRFAATEFDDPAWRRMPNRHSAIVMRLAFFAPSCQDQTVVATNRSGLVIARPNPHTGDSE